MADAKKRYYRKNVELFVLLNKMKLWPARSGVLHGIREINLQGKYALLPLTAARPIRLYNSQATPEQPDGFGINGRQSPVKSASAGVEAGKVFKDHVCFSLRK